MNILYETRVMNKRHREDEAYEEDIIEDNVYHSIFSHKKAKHEGSEGWGALNNRDIRDDVPSTNINPTNALKSESRGETSPMVEMQSALSYGMEKFSGFNKLNSFIHDPSMVLHQANEYVEHMLGVPYPTSLIHHQNQKMSSRQAMVISSDRAINVTGQSKLSSADTIDQSADLLRQHQHHQPKALSRQEIFAQNMCQRRQKSKFHGWDDDIDTGISLDEGDDYPSRYEPSGSSNRFFDLFYEFIWILLILVVAFIIILMSCSQLLILLPYNIGSSLYNKLNKIIESRILNTLIIASLVYYIHKSYVHIW